MSDEPAPLLSAEAICNEIKRREQEHIHRLAVANVYAAELEARIEIWKTRLDHADIEVAQARVSRDSYKKKLLLLLGAIKANGIVLEVEYETDE